MNKEAVGKGKEISVSRRLRNLPEKRADRQPRSLSHVSVNGAYDQLRTTRLEYRAREVRCECENRHVLEQIWTVRGATRCADRNHWFHSE